MKLLGINFGRSRDKQKALSSVNENRGGGWFRILESYTGAWQQNVVVDQNLVLSYHAVYSCMTLIASDIAKLRVKLVQQDSDGIWTEITNPAYSPVLRKPNKYQNRIQFWENWILSKLMRGNVYVLKVRDNRNVVVNLIVLDPNRVRPMVSDDGSVFYELQADNMSRITSNIIVPAREIIHDRFNCLFHPLVGVSPIFASGLAATQGLSIQGGSTKFFANQSRPSGILSTPLAIGDDVAARLKAAWDTNYSGENAGKVAVLGDDLKFYPMSITAHDAQLIEQLRWTAEMICSTFHVPPYKIGIGQMPSYNNIQALNVEYYSQCLQILIEAGELCLDEGLDMANDIGTEFDLDGLLRMDSVTQMEVLDKSKGIMAPNEQRKKLDLKPKAGGDSPMLQQQNFSLEALAKRDAKEDPFGTKAAPAPADPAAEPKDEVDPPEADPEAQKYIMQGALRAALYPGDAAPKNLH